MCTMAMRSLASQFLSRAMGALTVPTVAPFPARVRHLCSGVRSVCDRVAHVRGLASRLQAQGLSTVSTQALKEVLQRESAYEKSEYKGVAGVDELRRSWKLQEDAGGSLLTLTKEDGNSKLVITVDVNSQVQDDAYEDEEGEVNDGEKEEDDLNFQALTYIATIVKGDEALRFEVKASYDGLLDILHVNHQKADEDELADDAYEGPAFEDLDDELQEEFTKYLESWGLSPEFNQKLLEISQDKEQREYMGWLERIHKFVA